MPSLATRLAVARIGLNGVDTAVAAAQAAADTATAAVTEIQSGTLDLSAVKVGGVRFIESGGSLVAEP
jgi:hypothetical protein